MLVGIGANIDQTNLKNQTAVHLAIQTFPITEFLVLKGCRTDIIDIDGNTAISRCWTEGHPDVIDFWRSKGYSETNSNPLRHLIELSDDEDPIAFLQSITSFVGSTS